MPRIVVERKSDMDMVQTGVQLEKGKGTASFNKINMVQNKPSNTSSTNEKLKAEHILQAVVVADAAEPRFRPLTLTRPRVCELHSSLC